MAKLVTTEVEDYILNGQSRTFREICDAFFADDQQERQIDKIIQRLRRTGKLTKSRRGRDQLWTATPSKAASHV